ncbi:hypothetical protein SAMN06265221_12819 [Paracoccus laeviglucosivorans]|uniref:Uncharacterized protein n=1 Tax=Paracoccus laeviglucosivorans TaxID=1197861 RepID=A0A521FN45_9RHOB|nr:hypothetical protein SAMN06265221_12819 [Paracoccus laeviglucosivorans]
MPTARRTRRSASARLFMARRPTKASNASSSARSPGSTERSLRSLYCCSDSVRGRGAAVTNLSHRASFQSKERIAPLNRGIKRLERGCCPSLLDNPRRSARPGLLDIFIRRSKSRGSGRQGLLMCRDNLLQPLSGKPQLNRRSHRDPRLSSHTSTSSPSLRRAPATRISAPPQAICPHCRTVRFTPLLQWAFRDRCRPRPAGPRPAAPPDPADRAGCRTRTAPETPAW